MNVKGFKVMFIIVRSVCVDLYLRNINIVEFGRFRLVVRFSFFVVFFVLRVFGEEYLFWCYGGFC